MNKISTARDVISLWPSRPSLMRDLNAQAGEKLHVDRIHKWVRSGAIPAGYHARIIRAANARGISLTAEDMVRVHDAVAKVEVDAVEVDPALPACQCDSSVSRKQGFQKEQTQ